MPQTRSDGGAGESTTSGITSQLARDELDRILKSPAFLKSARLSKFLRFVVEETLSGRGHQLKESLVGVKVFDREPTYDPRIDAVVRTEAVKLRNRLTEYYEADGRRDPVRIELSKGSYVPAFVRPEAAGNLRLSRTQLLWVFGAIAFAALAAYWIVNRAGTAGKISGGLQPAIAVLPFVNLSPDKQDEYLSDGLTEELTDALGKVEGLRVVARTSAFQFRSKADDVREIGKRLNVAAILEGSVRKEGDRLRVTARLIQVAGGYRLWSETYDRELKDVLAIEEEIARSVVGALKLQFRLPPGTASLRTQSTEDVALYTLYLKARYLSESPKPEDVAKSIGYFEQVIASDPKYAPAYAALSGAYARLVRRQVGAPRDLCPKAKAAAIKALELDSKLGAAHATLAEIKAYFDYDWAGAEKEFQEALKLEPNNGDLHGRCSLFLIVQGRFEESLAELKRYFEVTPASAHHNERLGLYYYRRRQWDEVIKFCSRDLEIDPRLAVTRTLLGIAYLEKGRHTEAIEQLEEAVRVDGSGGGQGSIMPLGYAYAVLGRKDDAAKCLNRLKELSKFRYVTEFNLAAIYAGLGQKDKALECLERAYEERAPNVVFAMWSEPYFDSLHSEQRFLALVRKIGLEKLTRAP